MGVATTVRNMATLKLVLDKRRSRADGTYPILLRIYHESRSLALPSKIFVLPKHWNEATESVKRTHLEYVHYNSKLQQIKNDAFLKLSELAATHAQGYSYNTLVSSYREDDVTPAPPTRHTIQSFWEEEIQCMNRANKYGNMRVSKMALDVLKKECNLDVPFENVNYSFLKSLESSLLHRNLKINTISVYLRALRAIYNMAINKDIVNASYYPFRKYRIKSEKTVPHVLPLEHLRQYFQLDLDVNHPCYKSWLLGKLSFLLCGINFTDLALLTSDNIKNGRVIYKRAKTRKLYSILLLMETRAILDKIKVDNNPTLCAVLTPTELKSGEKLPYIIRDRNKQFNKQLALIGKMIGSEVNIRSYTFRYTIANLCKQLGYDIGIISEMLGHSYGQSVTSGYLLAYDKKVLDDMLKNVFLTIVKIDSY
jgi:integrase/recombinase XerD